MHLDEPLLRGTKDWRLPEATRSDVAFYYSGRYEYWDLVAALGGLHAQKTKGSDNRFLGEDGAIWWEVMSLMTPLVYPGALVLPNIDECELICEASPAFLLPQNQRRCFMFGQQEHRENILSEIPREQPRTLGVLLVNVTDGTSYQIAFGLNTSAHAPHENPSRLAKRASFGSVALMKAAWQ